MTSPKVEPVEYTVTRQYFDNALAAAREEGARKAIAAAVSRLEEMGYEDSAMAILHYVSIPEVLKEKS